MCGRKTLTKNKLEIIKEFSLDEWDNLIDWNPNYNIAPTQNHPIIINNDGIKSIRMGRWGLVPGWEKDLSISSNMINARIETVNEKPSFKKLINNQRCLVPVDGYYEWKTEPHGKQPYHIHIQDMKLFTLAGLMNIWLNSNENPVLTYTIMTTRANSTLYDLHHRMPVTISKKLHTEWINPNISYSDLSDEIIDQKKDWEYYPVSPIVNYTKEDNPNCILPYKPPQQENLFG